MSAININKNNFQRMDIKVGKPPELASQFGVMSIPTPVVMNGGKIVNQAMGARPRVPFLECCKEVS